MFEDAAAKKFDAVLFWSLDRFSRVGTYENAGSPAAAIRLGGRLVELPRGIPGVH
jgi:hypothetical protein